jgi:hypothetical protein
MRLHSSSRSDADNAHTSQDLFDAHTRKNNALMATHTVNSHLAQEGCARAHNATCHGACAAPQSKELAKLPSRVPEFPPFNVCNAFNLLTSPLTALAGATAWDAAAVWA